jgi:hypothetical protein
MIRGDADCGGGWRDYRVCGGVAAGAGGARVTVCDRGRMGGGELGGGGDAGAGGEFGEDSRWGRLGVESLALYPGFVAELEAATGPAD